jgi:hypothetical protein
VLPRSWEQMECLSVSRVLPVERRAGWGTYKGKGQRMFTNQTEQNLPRQAGNASNAIEVFTPVEVLESTCANLAKEMRRIHVIGHLVISNAKGTAACYCYCYESGEIKLIHGSRSLFIRCYPKEARR